MRNPNESSKNLDLNPAERIEILDPSQYSLQAIVDDNGKEKINLSIHCSPKQAARGPLRVFKDESGNYGVGFVIPR